MSFIPDKTKFKNAQGNYLLRPIFYEMDSPGRPYAQYSLKSYDSEFEGKVYPSLQRLFVELEDPTEYLFAEAYLDSWDHWKRLSSAPFMQDYLKDWREELELRLKAKALVRIRLRAEANQKDSLTADRLLLSGGWKADTKDPVGRPTKQRIAEEADKLSKERSVFDEDFKRIMSQSSPDQRPN